MSAGNKEKSFYEIELVYQEPNDTGRQNPIFNICKQKMRIFDEKFVLNNKVKC